MKRRATRALLVFCLGTPCACDGHASDGGTAQRADAGPDARDSGLLPLPPIPRCSPNFDSIRADIIAPTCALPLCHIGGDSFFELIPGEPSATLIGVRSSCGDWIRVVPGDPERSYLWHKLTRDHPDCGDRMPWGYERLPDNALACIRAWILSL